VKVLSAALTKSTDVIVKMDPYPVLEFIDGTKGKKVRGPTHKSGHKAPKWNWEYYHYFVPNENNKTDYTLRVAIFEEDKVTAHDLIGESAPVNILKICPNVGKQIQT
jgi:hypothetical protein